MRLLPGLSDRGLDELQAGVAFALIGVSLLALSRAYLRAWSVWRPVDAWDGRALGALTALGAALRWLVAPKWIVTIYIGYHLTQQALDLYPVSHYGVGSSALYHLLFGLLPADHASLLWTNSVIGALTLPLVATWARRYLDDARAGLVVAALVATLPLFIKNDNSDANHVPALWWLFGGLVLLDEFFERRETPSLLLAASLLCLTAISRPEMPTLLPVILAVLVAAWRPPRALLGDRRVWLTLGACAIALTPQVEHVLRQLDTLQQNASLPGLGPNWRGEFLRRLSNLNTLITPSLYPQVLLGAALFGALLPVGRYGRRLALLLAAAPALSVYSLDLCRANMARVHVPSALLVTIAAGGGIAAIASRLRGRAPRLLLGAAVLALLAPAWRRSAQTLWAPTNEQAEEEFLRAAIARLPRDGRFTYVRIGHGDREIIPGRSEYTHDHFPDYLLAPPWGRAQKRTIREWIERPDFSRPVYFFSGTRCFARMRPPALPVPRGDNHQPACQQMHELFSLEPVYTRAVPNRGDVWLEYYGDAPTLRLTLYRVRPRAR